jgi:hypothetical protein
LFCEIGLRTEGMARFFRMMKKIPTWHSLSTTRPGRLSRGFALVIALGLMSFIVLLLLSLTAFVRVETKASDQAKQTLAARQNALLGMHIALGKLQELTGPDQRITTSAALFEEAAAISEPHWIGVWQSNPEIAANDPQVPLGTAAQRNWDQRNADSKLSSARAWLVSSGSGTVPDPIVGAPAGIVMRQLANGEGVRADFQLLNNGSGAFAFHVSDESLKARINLADPHRNSSDSLIAQQAALVAQRFAPEAVFSSDELSGLPAGFDWSSVQSLSQLALFGIDSTPLEEVFTTRAASVLADVRQGGLRRDLTAIARLPETPIGRAALGNGPTVDSNALPQSLQDTPFLYTVEELQTETIDGSPMVNPNMGALNAPIQGPRIEALWDFMNHGRYISSQRVKSHAPAIANWLRFINREFLRVPGITEPLAYHALFSGISSAWPNEREINMIQPFQLMALGNNLTPTLEPDEHLLINSGINPILTELIFYVRISLSDNQIYLNVHPYLEITNPYDIEIQADYTLNLTSFFLRLCFDFKLIDENGVLPDRVWSLENYSGGSTLFEMRGRSLANLTRSLANPEAGGGPIRTQSNLALTLALPGGSTFSPGETKGFVAAGNTAAGNINLTQGENWREFSLQIPVRSYSFEGAEVLYDERWPQFADDEVDLDDYNLILVRANAMPVDGNRPGTEISPLGWHASFNQTMRPEDHGGQQAVQVAYHNIRIPLSREQIGKESAVGSGADVGDAFVFELEFAKVDEGSWVNADPQDAGVIQLRALSADDFETGDFGVDGMNQGAGIFLGQSNPRAFIMNDNHGFGGARNFEATGWTSGFYQEGIHQNLNSSGWGESKFNSRPTRLFHVSRRHPLSLGMLQHWNVAYATNDPAYLVGSSLPPFANLARNETVALRRHASAGERYQFNNTQLFDYSQPNDLPNSFTMRRTDFIFDSAFYLNRALWDSWFFSTIPAAVDPQSPAEWPNSRFTVIRPDEPNTVDNLLAYDRAAGNLLMSGGFNINSTSEKAWAAVLAARLGLGLNGQTGASNRLYYPRMPGMTSGSNIWSNARPIQLSDIYQPGQETNPGATTLSKLIVKEIRERGPFLSLSHFINRLLVNDERGEKGALQAALEASRINQGNGGFTYAPGSVTQGDILGPLGPVIAARGDTFVIRTVGEVRDPQTGRVISRSWAEATVQRRPEYIDATNPPEAIPADLSLINQRFGRRYEVIEFRWIDEPQAI